MTSALATCVQHCTGGSGQRNPARKSNKRHPDEKEEATATQTVQCWHRARLRNQRNGNECPEINPHVEGQLIFAKMIKWGKESVPLLPAQIVLGQLNIEMQKNESGPLPHPSHKRGLKTDQNVKGES